MKRLINIIASLFIGAAVLLAPPTGAGGAMGAAVPFVPPNPLGTGAAVILHPNGKNVPFRAADTAAARGAALVAAKAAAVSGDVIVVSPGTYTISTSLAKNGVNWWFAPGASVLRNDTSYGSIWDDGNTAMVFDVEGGNFTRAITTLPGSGNANDYGAGVMRTRHANTRINFRFNDAQITFGEGADFIYTAVLNFQGGVVNFSGNRVLVNGADALGQALGIGIWWDNGDCNGYVHQIHANAGNNVCIAGQITPSTTGEGRFNADDINGPIAAQTILENVNSRALWINSKNTITGAIGVNGGKMYVTTQKFLGYLATSADSSEVWLNIDKQAGPVTDAVPLIDNGGGIIRGRVGHFDGPNGGTCTEIIKSSAASAVTKLSGEDLVARTGQDAVLCTAGTVKLKGYEITPASGKVALKRTGGTLAVSHGVDFPIASTSGTITYPTFTTITSVPVLPGAAPPGSIVNVDSAPYWTGDGTSWLFISVDNPP